MLRVQLSYSITLTANLAKIYFIITMEKDLSMIQVSIPK